MKIKLERLMYFLLLAPPAPLAGFMGGWWLAYSLLPEKWIASGAISGLLLGILADIFIIKYLVDRAHALSAIFWAVVILFYAVGLFGFFMGVPILNIGLALPVGFLAGSRLAYRQASNSKVQATAHRISLINTGLLSLACLASAFFALSSPSTPADLQGMLALPFPVTPLMIRGFILVGGVVILVINYFLTLLAVRFTYRLLSTT
jgi:hypothetical protein